MDLITYLEENSKIDSEYIEDFFGLIDYDEFYIDLEVLMKWCKIENKEEYRKEIIEKYRENIEYKKEDEKILLNLFTTKILMDDENKKKIFELEKLREKYNKYKLRKLKKKIRLFKKNLQNNNKVVLNTINTISNIKEDNEKPKCDINDINYGLVYSSLLNRIIFFIFFILLICRIVYIFYSLFTSCNSESNVKYNIVLSIFNKLTIFILIAVFLVKFFSLLSSVFYISNCKK